MQVIAKVEIVSSVGVSIVILSKDGYRYITNAHRINETKPTIPYTHRTKEQALIQHRADVEYTRVQARWAERDYRASL